MARYFLEDNKVQFRFHDVNNPREREILHNRLEKIGIRANTVPQIFACKAYIGGYSDMMFLQKGDVLHEVLDQENVPHGIEKEKGIR
jgi:glutaredoxin